MEITALTIELFDEFYRLVETMVSKSEFKDAKPNRERFLNMLENSNFCYYVAIQSNKIIGFIGGVAHPYFFSDRLRVSDLGFYVTPEYRGSSAAVRLIKKLEDWSRSKGVTDVHLGQTTALKVDKTLKFYNRQGYSLVGFNTVKHLGAQ